MVCKAISYDLPGLDPSYPRSVSESVTGSIILFVAATTADGACRKEI